MPSLSSTSTTGAKPRRKHHHHHHHHRHCQRHVDENAPQSSSVITTSPDDNGPLSATTTVTTTTIAAAATMTTKTDDQASPLNHHTLRENQQISDRASPVNGPGLAKPIAMTSSFKEQQQPSSSSSSSSPNMNPVGKKRIDAALEKNIETIVTQVRRTTTKPSQLTQNDLQLFDSTTSLDSIKNGHHSRETTPITSNTNSKYTSSSSREMTPDSINADSANEDQQQTVRNGHHYPRSMNHHQPAAAVVPPHHHPSVLTSSATADLTSPFNSSYAPQPWPPAVYPFAHPHHGLYLPYPPPPLGSTTTPTNGLPPFYPSYDPLFIEQHYGPQGLSAFYTQQQQARLLQEQSTISDNLSSTLTTPTTEHSEHSPVGSGESIKSSDSMSNGHRKKKPLSQHQSNNTNTNTNNNGNGNITKLSPEVLSDGTGANDADSIVSHESQKSNTTASMPVLEDGLSDSENRSDDEQISPSKSKANGRHQSTQSDFLYDSNHSSLVTSSHKRQFAKSTPTATANGSESPSQQQSFYIRPPPPSSFVQPMKSTRSTPPIQSNEPQYNQPTNHVPEETSAAPADEGTVNPKPIKKKDYDTDEETDKLLGVEHRINAKNQAIRDAAISKPTNKPKNQEENSSVLIEGVLFRCRYLGSTQLLVEGNPTKASRMIQAQEAVGRIKAPQGESQPSVEVDLFISTEKIMVLNTDLQDILMDHSLRSISYIADIGDLVVLMAKRRYLQHADDHTNGNDDSQDPTATTPTTRRVVSINQKMICHVFESDEAQSIAHSIGQAFQVAYVEFLKANGIDDPSFTRDIDYQEVLNQQEIGSEELDRFSKKECQREVIIPKAKNEPLGIVIVESGWGSMLPTVVIANMMPTGPASRCGHLNIGDQIISVNGISLVGLPLSSCQTQIKNVKHLTTVRLVVVPCPPVVEVLIRRPDTKYQLGFSVQNGIICSLLRGGIAERGGVRVGHRIIEINGHSVVATQHERIVSMLSNSVGELRMKTMPTQMYRLLTGQENPTYI